MVIIWFIIFMKNLFHHTMDRLGGSGHTKKLHLVELKSENSNMYKKKFLPL